MDEGRGAIMADDIDTIWLTYDEAADRLRIKPASVRRRAAARKWPRRTGNDKLARVGIPKSAITDITPDIIPDIIHAITPDETEKNLKTQIADLREKIARMEGEATGTAARLMDLTGDRDAWRKQAEQLSEALRVRRGNFLTRIFGH